MKYTFEIDQNGILRLFINGQKLMARPALEMRKDAFVKQFVKMALEMHENG